MDKESTIEEAFKEACDTVWEHRQSDEYASVREQLYGLYKVATEGKCEEPKPEQTVLGGNEKAKTKWEAWMRASTFSKEEAMARYVSIALSVVKSRGDAAEILAAASASKSGERGSGSKILAALSGGGSGLSIGGEEGSGGVGVGGDTSRGISQEEATEAEKSQRGEIERLRKHTESLENYLGAIREELCLATDGLGEYTMSGWLSKWRDRDVYLWGSTKWEERYFTLSGDQLTTYKPNGSGDSKVDSVMSLKGCVLRDEGVKTGKPPGRGKPAPEHHVFGLYLKGANVRGPDAGVLLRLSSDDEEEAERWISALSEACNSPGTTGASAPPGREGAIFEKLRAGVFSDDDDDDAERVSPSASTSLTSPPPPPPPSREGTPSFSSRSQHHVRLPRQPSLQRGLSRKGVGLQDNLEQLKRLSRHLSMDTLDALAEMRRTAQEGPGDGEGKSTEKPSKEDGEGEGDGDGEIEKKESKKKKKKKFDPTGYPASRPMHKEARASPLSGDADSQNYRGFLNLMAILLLVTNSRLITANLRRYGILASVPRLTEQNNSWDVHFITGTLSLAVHAAFGLFVEMMAMPTPGNEKGKLGGSEAPVLVLHGINITLCLSIATVVVWRVEGSPAFGFAYLLTAVIVWAKLVSYAHANRDLRLAWRDQAQSAKEKDNASGEGKTDGVDSWRGGGWSIEEVSGGVGGGGGAAEIKGEDGGGGIIGGGIKTGRTRYPDNIGVRDLLYFGFAPTLCYQPDYPRSGERRYRYIFSLVARLMIVGGMMSGIADQYMLPTLHEFHGSDPAANVLISFERLLTLAVPNTYFWLLGFYAFFHLTLNLLAELLRFGDRVFYRDWWNATTIDAYWRLWNTPVHYWMMRHIYFPCLRAGMSKTIASGVCFLLSALFHELLVSVPFHMVKFYAFVGMIGNVPLVPLTKLLNKRFGNEQAGNWIFWVLFCVVGQPMSLLCYYRDYCREHQCSNPLSA